MALVPEAGAEVSVLTGFGIALISLLMWLALRGLMGVWHFTFGAIFDKIGGIKIGTWKASGHPFGFLSDFSHGVENAMADAASGFEHAMGFWFHQSARLQGWIADETWKLARDSLHFGEWLVMHYIPVTARYAVESLFPWPAVRHLIESALALALSKAGHVAHAVAHAVTAPIYRTVVIPHLGELQWIHRHWRAITAAAAAAGGLVLAPGLAIPRLWRGIDDVESDVRKLAKRLTKVETLFGATALSLAMANVLGIPNARCLRRGPIGRVARALCGLDSGLLDLLLLGTAEAFIATDLCGFTDLLIKQAEAIRPALLELVDVEDALIGCHGTSKPIDFALPALSLPAMPAASVLAA